MRTIFVFLAVIISGSILTNCNSNTRRKQAADTIVRKDTVVFQQKNNTPEQIEAKPEVPVLCFHRIDVGMKSEFEVSPSAFESDIKILADSGYHSISPAQLYDYLVFNKALPEKPVMITFDDSRVEHFAIAGPVLEKYGFRGVFFIMTITLNKKNYMTSEQVAQLAKAGHTIGLHTWDHVMVTRYKTDADWIKEVAEPQKKLEKITGKEVEYFAYPDGIYDNKSAGELSNYFKLSFILSSKRDSTFPLQTVRRMIVPGWKPQEMLKSLHRTFGKKKL